MSSKEEDEPTLPPCRVCGRRASGLHFGVITCEACKAFYKRSRGRNRPFTCRGKETGKCQILNGKTPLCSFCRLQTCLRFGMCREGINKGRCPIEKKAELLLEAREHQQTMMRQKMLNERRGMEGSAETPNSEQTTEGRPSRLTSHPAIPSIDTKFDLNGLENSQTHQNTNLNEISPKSFTSNHLQIILDNPLTTMMMCEPPQARLPVQPSTLKAQHQRQDQPQGQPKDQPQDQSRDQTQDKPYGEFMNLLMAEDFQDVAQDEVFDLVQVDIGLPNIGQTEIEQVACSLRVGSLTAERLMEIITWLDVVTQADIETQLYDLEEIEDVLAKTSAYKASQAGNGKRLGLWKPLPREIYNEIYLETGVDVDQYLYRQKASDCVTDCGTEINIYLEFLKRLPLFSEHDLNDRLRLAKGGFVTWSLLSSLEVYDPEVEGIIHSEDVMWTGDDFIGYFGSSFENFGKDTLDVFKKAALTQEELAVLKLYSIYQDRPYLDPKGSGRKMQEQRDLICDSLTYLFEAKQGKTQKTPADVKKAIDLLGKISDAINVGVREWPLKFPELEYPRIWLELTDLLPEEELVVAVSAMKIAH